MLPSPGINLEKHSINKSKIITECDLVQKHFGGSVLAITGSLGKTTVTSVLGNILKDQYETNVAAGGNIGTAMLELINRKSNPSKLVLEISSFQLEHNNFFAPDIAGMTNIYPNHLDRHGTIESYLEAKLNLFRFQQAYQKAILPMDLLHKFPSNFIRSKIQRIKSKITFIKNGPIENHEEDLSEEFDAKLIFTDENHIKIYDSKLQSQEKIFDLNNLPEEGFIENWLYVISALRNLNIEPTKKMLQKAYGKFSQDYGEHRLEFCGKINDVKILNDSKSTVIDSTISAIEKISCAPKSLILILGGLSKGTNRSQKIMEISKHPKIKLTICFGDERNSIPSDFAYKNLESAVKKALEEGKAGDAILFSPGGASFDLFKNYKERGMEFKKLVNAISPFP